MGLCSYRRVRTTLKVILAVILFLAALESTSQNLVDYSKPASHFPFLISMSRMKCRRPGLEILHGLRIC
jgi:hypothetical protein